MPSATSQLSELTDDYIDEAAEVLAGAFADYPTLRWLFADAGERYDEHVLAVFRLACLHRVAVGWPCPVIRVGGRIVAVLCATGLGQRSEPPAVGDAEAELMRSVSAQTTHRMEQYNKLLQANRVARPHFDVAAVGVVAGARGRGYGGRLLRYVHALSAAHPSSTGVELSTQSAHNVDIYKHLGYQVIAETALGDMPTWFMFRPDET